MKNIKTFSQHNEDANWKKGLAAAALTAGLALGGPQKATSQIPTRQEQRMQETQYQTVIEAPGKNAEQVKDHLYKLINDIRVYLYDTDSPIKQLNYQPFQTNKIKAQVQFEISPKDRRGVTEAEIEILIEDGSYTIMVKKMRFIHEGQQPNSLEDEIISRYKPLVGTAASGGVKRAFGGKIGGVGDVVGNVAASALQDWAIRQPKPKQNFDLKNTPTSDPQVPSGMKKKDYEDYLSRLNTAVEDLFSMFRESPSDDRMNF